MESCRAGDIGAADSIAESVVSSSDVVECGGARAGGVVVTNDVDPVPAGVATINSTGSVSQDDIDVLASPDPTSTIDSDPTISSTETNNSVAPVQTATVPEDEGDEDDGVHSPTADDMIDSSDFRSLTAGHLHHESSSPYSPGPLNGRMSPQGFSTTSSYATLTPLQPLPPISTVSDKFRDHYHHHHPSVSGSFTLMQNNSIPGMVSMNQYQYDKLNNLGIAMSPTLGSAVMGSHQTHSAMPSPPSYHENGLNSPTQKSLSPNGYDTYRCLSHGAGSLAGQAPPSPVEGLQSPGPGPMLPNINGLHQNQSPTSSTHLTAHQTVTDSGPITVSATTTGLTPAVSREHKLSPKSSPTPAAQAPGIVMGTTPVQVTMTVSGATITNVATVVGNISGPSSSSNHGSPGGGGAGEVEEINTKELAARISAELKRYSIPQAIFAQRVLCRSQGTLSDLLRNPKPWSKLKSGRETFRRMYKWLEEPEFQRMSALRLAGEGIGNAHSGDLYGGECQMRMRNANQRAWARSKPRKSPHYDLQAEGGSANSRRAHARPEETTFGLYRFAEAHPAGHI